MSTLYGPDGRPLVSDSPPLADTLPCRNCGQPVTLSETMKEQLKQIPTHLRNAVSVEHDAQTCPAILAPPAPTLSRYRATMVVEEEVSLPEEDLDRLRAAGGAVGDVRLDADGKTWEKVAGFGAEVEVETLKEALIPGGPLASAFGQRWQQAFEHAAIANGLGAEAAQAAMDDLGIPPGAVTLTPTTPTRIVTDEEIDRLHGPGAAAALEASFGTPQDPRR